MTPLAKYSLHRACFAGTAVAAAWFCFHVFKAPETSHRTFRSARSAVDPNYSPKAAALKSSRSPEPTARGLTESSAPPEPPVLNPQNISGGLETWARERSDDAMTWALGTPNGPDRVVVVEILCLQLAQTDPSAAAELVELLGANGYVLDNIIQQWAERDLVAAEAYVLSRPMSPDRDRLVSRLAFIRSKTNPAEAAKWVADQISPGETQEDAALTVFHQWMRANQNAALAWMQTFPNGRLRDRAFDELESAIPPVAK